jgi:chaperone modulatory protein CbpM
MSTKIISITSCCLMYEIEHSFIDTLEESGLLEVVSLENERYLPYSALPELERYIRWHYELNINHEGIETIKHLLHKIDSLKQEVGELKSRLRVYEL